VDRRRHLQKPARGFAREGVAATPAHRGGELGHSCVWGGNAGWVGQKIDEPRPPLRAGRELPVWAILPKREGRLPTRGEGTTVLKSLLSHYGTTPHARGGNPTARSRTARRALGQPGARFLCDRGGKNSSGLLRRTGGRPRFFRCTNLGASRGIGGVKNSRLSRKDRSGPQRVHKTRFIAQHLT